MNNVNYKTTKYACFSAYFTMSSIFCVPPLLFVTFREMYGISYTLLGTLVLVNFFTQLAVDLIFTVFAKHFNTKLVIRIMPIITSLGLLLYALIPTLFPQSAYIGLLAGTVIFSVSAGLSEVLLSPLMSAIPSDNPQRDMSTLHSLYAFGVFTMVLISSAFFAVFGSHNWVYLISFLAILPIISAFLFIISPMPDMEIHDTKAEKSGVSRKRRIGLMLCTLCIFCGSCAENVMASWLSSYMENALGISKMLGDVLGVAMFAILLGVGRISYAKFGKNIMRVILIGMIGSVICYVTVGVSSNVIVAFIACIMTGLCSALLWPGTLIMMEENIPHAGVAAFALMAAGGDLGASVAPQLMGIVIDNVSQSNFAINVGASLGLTAEQVGLKIGMLISALFPMVGVVIVFVIIRFFRQKDKAQSA